jgi:hypothetical protein
VLAEAGAHGAASPRVDFMGAVRPNAFKPRANIT